MPESVSRRSSAFAIASRLTPMRVTVRLFAGLREHAGTGRRGLELGDRARVEGVWPELRLGEEPAGLVFAVNRVYVERGGALSEGDEVALIPPVSGGAF